MSEAAEVRRLRADLNAQVNRVVVLEQQVKEQGDQMNDWVKSGIEHRTSVNLELQSIKEFMTDLKEIPVNIATMSANLDNLIEQKKAPSFWTGPNVRWVAITLIVALVLAAGVNNAEKVKEVIEVIFR